MYSLNHEKFYQGNLVYLEFWIPFHFCCDKLLGELVRMILQLITIFVKMRFYSRNLYQNMIIVF